MITQTKIPLRQQILHTVAFHQLLPYYRKEKNKADYYKMWVKHNPFNLGWDELKVLGIQPIDKPNLPPYFTFQQLLAAVGYQIN